MNKSEHMFSFVKEVVTEKIGVVAAKDLSGETRLADLGIDSIAVLPIIIQLAEKFDCDLLAITSNLQLPRTINDLASMFATEESLNQ